MWGVQGQPGFLERGKTRGRKGREREREYGEIKWMRGIDTETSPLSSVTASHLLSSKDQLLELRPGDLAWWIHSSLHNYEHLSLEPP